MRFYIESQQAQLSTSSLYQRAAIRDAACRHIDELRARSVADAATALIAARDQRSKDMLSWPRDRLLRQEFTLTKCALAPLEVFHWIRRCKSVCDSPVI